MHDLTMAQTSAARQQLAYQLRGQPLGNAAAGMTFNNLEERDDLYSTHQSRVSELTPQMARLQARVNSGEGPIRNHSVSRAPPELTFMQNSSYGD